MTDYEDIRKLLYKLEDKGVEFIPETGATLIGRSPEIAPEAWLNNMFAPVTSNDVVRIPSKETFEAVDADIERSRNFKREAGSHIYSDGKVVQWDIGTELKSNDTEMRISVGFFKVDGHQRIGNIFQIDAYWHIHPNIGSGFGKAKPSSRDVYMDMEMRKKDVYKGQTFVIGDYDGNITFYKGNKIILTTNYLKLKSLAK